MKFRNALDSFSIIDLKNSQNLVNEFYNKQNNISSFNKSFYSGKDLTQRFYKTNLINNSWYIRIPKINLKANIAEGVSDEVLSSYVGHFLDSAVLDGNVCLAAHNRGYDVNYFANIKDLDYGDRIYYCYNNIENCYVVNEISVIEETDWSNLEASEESIITLITCVEDMPNLRRCIQGMKVP